MALLQLRLLLTLAFLGCSVLAIPVDSEVPVEPFADFEPLPGLTNLYKLHKELIRWGPAAQKCQDEGAHLLVINNLAEAQGIFPLFNQIPNPGTGKQDLLHVGIYDAFSEGAWHALTGGLLAELDYYNWATGKPTISTTYNCGAITRSIQYTDVQCDTAAYIMPFICEKEMPATSCHLSAGSS